MIPAEPDGITSRRAKLLIELDSLGARHPADDWIAGMRVYYRVEAHQPALAAAAAHECLGTAWWCAALIGYAHHAAGRISAADSAFVTALAAMPDSVRCRWRDIAMLLPGDARTRYEQLGCNERLSGERRYWLLSSPRLATTANDWRTEFYSRRVVTELSARAPSLDPPGWGRDATELLLRYGRPVAWSRVTPASLTVGGAISIMGHDPVPSFAFAPREELLDSLASSADDGWDLHDLHAPSRYAPTWLRRVVPAEAQFARFRRGDSTLLVVAYAASHDSLTASDAALTAAVADGRSFSTARDSSRTGRAMIRVIRPPTLVGIEVMDSTSGTLARALRLYAPVAGSTTRLSDLLLFRYGDTDVPMLDSALARAITGNVVPRNVPLGVYWETYDVVSDSGLATAVTVERVDGSLFRKARQRLGLVEPDSPLRLRWRDPRPEAGIASRIISLDLTNLPDGRYRITLTITPAAGEPVVGVREVELRDR